MVLCIVGAVFASVMVLDAGSNPFSRAEAGTQPFGLNPLLLHPAMVLHPPALFIGYVGLAVPFAFAVSTLLLGRGDKLWVQRSQKWAVVGWLFLSLGIGLGAWWAYVVLSFGGYWGWDPVENTSLVPWLTATALLHAFTLYRSRGLFKRWALGLAAATFWLTILATWTTRTGLIQSVHAFEQRTLLVWILSASCWRPRASASASWPGAGGASRATTRSSPRLEGLHVLPHHPAARSVLRRRRVRYRGRSARHGQDRRPTTYNAIAQPLGVVSLAMIAICPLLAWRRTEGAQLRRTLILPSVTAVLSVPLWLYLGFQSNVRGFIGLLVCGFAFGAVIQSILRSAQRAAGPDKSLWAGLGRAFTGSRTRTASYIVHFGMVLVVAGLLGSNVYKSEKVVRGLSSPANGERQRVHAHLQVDGREHGAQGSVRSLRSFGVSRDGTPIGTLAPHTDVYPVSGAAVRAVILGGPSRTSSWSPTRRSTTTSRTIDLRLVIFPLIRWVWIGSILLCVGAVVSLWPAGAAESRSPARQPPADEDGGASAEDSD